MPLHRFQGRLKTSCKAFHNFEADWSQLWTLLQQVKRCKMSIIHQVEDWKGHLDANPTHFHVTMKLACTLKADQKWHQPSDSPTPHRISVQESWAIRFKSNNACGLFTVGTMCGRRKNKNVHQLCKVLNQGHLPASQTLPHGYKASLCCKAVQVMHLLPLKFPNRMVRNSLFLMLHLCWSECPLFASCWCQVLHVGTGQHARFIFFWLG